MFRKDKTKPDHCLGWIFRRNSKQAVERQKRWDGREGFRIYLSLYAFDPFGINLGLIEFGANMEQGASMLAQTLAVPGWINMALCGDLKVLIVKQPV